VNRFLTIRTISKGKSLGQPPVSDEILEDLKEMVEKTLQISIACLSLKIGYNCIFIKFVLYKNSNL
jgi:hypothetical protein